MTLDMGHTHWTVRQVKLLAQAPCLQHVTITVGQETSRDDQTANKNIDIGQRQQQQQQQEEQQVVEKKEDSSERDPESVLSTLLMCRTLRSLCIHTNHDDDLTDTDCDMSVL